MILARFPSFCFVALMRCFENVSKTFCFVVLMRFFENVRKRFVSQKLGYGERGVCLEDASKGCLVPPNTDLVYDITLVRVAPTPTP